MFSLDTLIMVGKIITGPIWKLLMRKSGFRPRIVFYPYRGRMRNSINLRLKKIGKFKFCGNCVENSKAFSDRNRDPTRSTTTSQTTPVAVTPRYAQPKHKHQKMPPRPDAAIAQIELNAIDLSCDLIARFQGKDLPLAFYDDWVKVAADKVRHFTMITGYLKQNNACYGDSPTTMDCGNLPQNPLTTSFHG